MAHENQKIGRPELVDDRSNSLENTNTNSVSSTTPLQFESTLALSGPPASGIRVDAPIQSFSPVSTGDMPVLQPLVIENRSLTENRPIVAGSLDSTMSLSELAQNGVIKNALNTEASIMTPANNAVEGDSRPTNVLDGPSAAGAAAAKMMENLGLPTLMPVERVSQTANSSADAPKVLDQNSNRTFIMALGIDKGAAFDLQAAPNVLIRKDGKVEMLKDAEQPPFVIQLEGKPGLDAPTDAQMQAAKEIDSWILARKEISDKSVKENALKVQEQAAIEAQAQEEQIRAAERSAAERVANAQKTFSNSGSMSGQEAEQYFNAPQQSANGGEQGTEQAPQSSPEQADRTPTAPASQMLIDAIAHLSANKETPYETLRRTPEAGFAVGRYGLTADVFMSWLSSLQEFSEILGTPPDYSKLAKLMEKLAKQGKLPAKFAEQFKNPKFATDFGGFLDKMKSGQGTLNARDIDKFFPKEMQDSVIKGVLADAEKKGVKADQVALAMHLGKPVDKLSEHDKKDPKNQEYMSAALKVMGLSAAQHQAGKGDRIDWKQGSEPGSPLAFKIAHAAEANAKQNDTVGWCYREVADTLDKFGVHLYGNSAYMAAPQLAKNDHFKEVSTQNLKPGTVLVFDRSAGHPHGHITVYLGNGKEASDHVQGLVNFNAYGGVRAFEPIA